MTILDLQLIRSTSQLSGTCYIELLPGPYAGACWNNSSVFLTEQSFGPFEPIILRHHVGYDHYAFTELRRPTWDLILADAGRLASALRATRTASAIPGDLGFYFSTDRAEFESDLRANSTALANLIDDVDRWVRDALSTHESVTVLGL